MTKEQYFTLKSELKAMAQQIKSAKLYHHTAQKDFSTCERERGSVADYYKGLIPSVKWESARSEYNRLYELQLDLYRGVQSLKHDFRHLHMVYCFARGKTREQIERKVREGNEPDSKRLESLMEKYDVKESIPTTA